ncbi:MAG: alkaline phosphatase D family protein [Cellvibrionaceae bacterium]|nr:alkaline phosphatase D family protein [Cellvibrionaceae bacterium]
MKRRQFIKTSSMGALALGTAPSISFASARPQPSNAMASGDCSESSAVIWAKADRPSLMWVDLARDPSFNNYQRYRGGAALGASDYNAKTYPNDLNPGQQYFYRVQFESLDKPGLFGKPQLGQFKTASRKRERLRFCWSGDTAGQGYGIDASRGGMLTYKAMLARQPDFFIHSGDQIYADNPISASIQLSDGSSWRNIVTPGKAKVAESLQEFRENYYYNYLDTHLREFHRKIPSYIQWDDHEVVNNWYPGEILDDPRYREKSVSLLAERSRRALFDCNPITQTPGHPEQIYRQRSFGPLLDVFFLDLRSYRGPNSRNRQAQQSAATDFMGDRQLQWLKQALASSKATWKIIASDMPIGLLVTEWQSDVAENGANGDGPALGRELEIAELLQFIAKQDISNVHFITADVHYCASHYYDPAKAQFKNFKPFWEFVSGPLHAGTFGPGKLDNTFGPQLIFKGIPDNLTPNSPPSDNYQFFGEMEINPDSLVLTVRHFNRQGELLWEKGLEAEGV